MAVECDVKAPALALNEENGFPTANDLRHDVVGQGPRCRDQELRLPVKKLLSEKKLSVKGPKRATTYFAKGRRVRFPSARSVRAYTAQNWLTRVSEQVIYSKLTTV